MKKIITFPTLLGIMFLVGGIFTGVILLQSTKNFRLGATAENTPKDVRVSNITEHSFTVSWITDVPSAGFVKSGTNQSALDKTSVNQIPQPSVTHYADIENLIPQTQYYFKINSGGVDYDSNGIPWVIQTGSAIGEPETSILMSGQVIDQNGGVLPNVLVHTQLPGSTTISSFTNSQGRWLLPISKARTTNLSSFAPIDVRNTIVEIFIQGANFGISSAKIHPQNANPAPNIVIGSVNNFTNLNSNETSEKPSANLNLPQEESSVQESKLNVSATGPEEKSETVKLESHDEGELITTQTPEFFGEGPSLVTLTITLESEPITDTVKIPANGSWKWSPPKNLEPGNHKITISWRDTSGILRTLTRNFVVQAAEGPSFESSPSSQITTPTPTTSPTPVPTSPTPSDSANPNPPIPVSGGLTPTLMLLIMSIGIILLGSIALITH